jgi:hypothetical protein
VGTLSDKDFDAFDKSLEYGQLREDALARILFSTRVEVKSDKRAATTGNVFIEYQQGFGQQRLSGIATTKADVWAIEVPGICWVLIETERLKALARRARDDGRKTFGGDNHNKGALVPLEWIVLPFKEVP